jgi:hypothetical protein
VLECFPGLHLELGEIVGLRAHQRVGTGGAVSIRSDSEPASAVEAVIYIESRGDLITRPLRSRTGPNGTRPWTIPPTSGNGTQGP